MAEKIRKMIYQNAGEIGMTLLISVVGSLLVSFVIGGILTWGYTLTSNEKVNMLIASVNEIKTDVKGIRDEVNSSKTDLLLHKQSTPGSADALQAVKDRFLADIQAEVRRQVRIKGWQDVPASR